MVERVGAPFADKPPVGLNDDEITRLLGRVAVGGSSAAQTALDSYSHEALGFLMVAMTFESFDSARIANPNAPPDGWAAAYSEVNEQRPKVVAAIQKAERTMREELDELG